MIFMAVEKFVRIMKGDGHHHHHHIPSPQSHDDKVPTKPVKQSEGTELRKRKQEGKSDADDRSAKSEPVADQSGEEYAVCGYVFYQCIGCKEWVCWLVAVFV